MGVIFTTLLLMAITMMGAFKSVGFSRQRTQATTLANQALEQIRALPTDQLFLSSADTSTDSQLVPAGCLTSNTCTFQTRTVPVANLGSSISTPLAPRHVVTTTGSPGLTNYTVTSYVTIDPNDATGQTRIATVQVTWDHAQQGGLSASVQVESKLHTSPFTASAPGTHTYDATAQTTPGTITIAGTLLNQAGLNITFPLPTTNAYLSGGIGGTNVGSNPGVSGKQVSASTAASTLAGVTNTTAASTGNVYSAAGGAKSGPSPQTAAPGSLFNVNGSLANGLSLVSGTLSGQVYAGSVTQVDAVAASKADGTSSILSGTLPTNNLGYGSAQATQTGLIESKLNLVGLLNIPLVQVTPSGNTTPDQSTVAQNGTLAGPSQTFTATANKTFSEVDVLPTLNVVKLSTYKASASACASPTTGLCPASTAISDGNLSILGGVTIPLLNHSAGSLGLQTSTVSVGLASVVIGANVTLGSTTATSPGSGQVTSPVKVNVTLKISLLGLSLVDLTINIDLGDVITTANYS